MAYQDDKYENFMLHLGASRPALAKFADFTVAAVAAAGVPPLIAQEGPALQLARDAFRVELVARTGAAGTSQTGTDTEAGAFEVFQTFIQTTDVYTIQPYLLTHTAARATFYPDKLAGLTQAIKKNRLIRLTAYTKALEAVPALRLPVPEGAPAGTAAVVAGTAARALLTTYEAVANTKTTARATLKDAADDLGPTGTALAEALWETHCAALYVHRQAPHTARKYFDYAHLPHRNARIRKPKPGQ